MVDFPGGYQFDVALEKDFFCFEIQLEIYGELPAQFGRVYLVRLFMT